MSTYLSLPSALRRSFAVAAIAGSAVAIAGAQAAPAQENAGGAQTVNFATQSTTPQLGAAPDALFSTSSSSSSSSSADEAGTAAAQVNLASLEKNLNLPGANAQYGRRRYGSPRYRGGNTNADGSAKYGAYIGAGLTIPVGTNSDYLTTSYGIQAGVGRNFNKHLGVNFEFDYDHFGMTGQTISNQSYIYTGSYTNSFGIDANSHIWNFSIQPTYQIYSGEGLGAYITAGAGFYHKVGNFTAPQQATYCDYYGCYDVVANEVFDHYTSNAPGFDGGIGLTYKFSHFSNERLYGEVRYVYIDNSFRPGITVDNVGSITATTTNFFPQNSNTTSYFPIKFGLRF